MATLDSSLALRDAHFSRQLAAARAGSREALGELLQGCHRYLLLAANREVDGALRAKEGPSDLVQQTFVIAHCEFQSFRGQTVGELFAWLNRILERQVLNRVRHYEQTSKRAASREVSFGDNVRQDVQLVDQKAGPFDLANLSDERRRVRLAIARLPSDCQRVLELRTWQRLTFVEIGQVLGCSEDAAQKLWARAVERLGAALEAGW